MCRLPNARWTARVKALPSTQSTCRKLSVQIIITLNINASRVDLYNEPVHAMSLFAAGHASDPAPLRPAATATIGPCDSRVDQLGQIDALILTSALSQIDLKTHKQLLKKYLICIQNQENQA